MSINGKFTVGESKLGEVIGEFKQSDIPKMLYEISQKLVGKNIDFETFTKDFREEFNQVIESYKL